MRMRGEAGRVHVLPVCASVTEAFVFEKNIHEITERLAVRDDTIAVERCFV